MVRATQADGGLPLAELRLGHREPDFEYQPISSVAFAPSPDPKSQWLAATGSEFWLWNPVTQQYLVAADPGAYLGVAFAPTADEVFVVSDVFAARFTVRPFVEVWRTSFPQSRTLVRVRLVSVNGDGTCLCAAEKRTVFAIDPFTGRPRGDFRVKAQAEDIAFLPNSRLLAVADGSPTLRVYDTDTGTLAREYDWGIGGIHCVTFSHDGAMGAAGGDRRRVVVWDVD